MQKSELILPHDHLRAILHYSVITGDFYWLKPRQRVKVGSVAGGLHPNGYRYIRVIMKKYRTHRLAWFWVTGEWPQDVIDHINGIKDANYWLNLREATHSQNCCNTVLKSTNTSGYKGVKWYKKHKKWAAQITINKKRKHLGLFESIEKAYAERLKAEKELHGEFARNLG
jgi:hypothetical protein